MQHAFNKSFKIELYAYFKVREYFIVAIKIHMFTLVPLKMINCIPQMEVLVKICDYLKYLKTDLSYKPLRKYVKNEKILSLLGNGKAYSKEAKQRLKTMCLK